MSLMFWTVLHSQVHRTEREREREIFVFSKYPLIITVCSKQDLCSPIRPLDNVRFPRFP